MQQKEKSLTSPSSQECTRSILHNIDPQNTTAAHTPHCTMTAQQAGTKLSKFSPALTRRRLHCAWFLWMIRREFPKDLRFLCLLPMLSISLDQHYSTIVKLSSRVSINNPFDATHPHWNQELQKDNSSSQCSTCHLSIKFRWDDSPFWNSAFKNY